MQAAQAFFACDKNEMLAANFLFENADSLRAELEEDPGHGHAHSPPRPSSIPPRAPVAPMAPVVVPPPPPVAEVKKEEKKVESPPEKKEEGIRSSLFDVGSSLQLPPKPEEKK